MPDSDQEDSIEVQAKFPEKNGIWDILNSNFMLFVMSSIVLGLITFTYQAYDTHRKTIEDRSTRISHLGTELRYRLDNISSMVQDKFTYTTYYTAHGALLGEFGNKNPNDVIAGEYTPIYSEFDNRNIVSLIWELQDLERKGSKHFSLAPSIDAAHKLISSWDEDAEMKVPVSAGHDDSIWSFKRIQLRQDFNNQLQLIRKSIPAQDDS